MEWTFLGDECDFFEMPEMARAEHGLVVQRAVLVAFEVSPGDVQQFDPLGLLERLLHGRLEDAAPVFACDPAVRDEADGAVRQIADGSEHGRFLLVPASLLLRTPAFDLATLTLNRSRTKATKE